MAKLLSSLPVGALVKCEKTTYNGKPIIWKVMEHGHRDDPAGSTALVTEKIISLKAFDAKESGNSDSNRRSYGNNRYLYANLKQWLNSDAATGSWYAAQHSADAAPTNANVWSNYNEYDQEAGFLANFGDEMKSALMAVTKRTVKCSTDGGSYEDVTSKIFLLSNTEVGLSNENSIAEGSIYSLFNTASNRQCKPTAEAVSKNEYTSSSLSSTQNWYWWLRTPYASNSNGVRRVHTVGSLDDNLAYYGNCGVRPACCISSSILVSDTADTDGAYTIQWNAAPKISTASENLGDKNVPFDVSFTIKDPDGDTVTATVKLDGAEVMNLNPVNQSQTYTYSISGQKLNSLAVGSHNITITATDSFGNVSTKTIAFKRVASSIVISGSDTNLGSIWSVPEYKYTVTDSLGNAIAVYEYMDDVLIRTVNDAHTAGEITFDFADAFKSAAPEASHTAKVKAVNSSGAEVYRYITFKKTPDKLCFETKEVETDAPAQRIIVRINYDKTGSPGIKVEACNDAAATDKHWEDMTEEYLASKAHDFTNAPVSGYGVSIRVTISKTAGIDRVYCDGFGFSFD